MQICVHTYRFNLIKADFQVDWMTTQLNSFQNMLIRSRGGEHVLLFKIGLVCPTTGAATISEGSGTRNQGFGV